MSANNSFKPNLLRCTNNLADKACHVVGSATQVGLTQALALMPKISASLAIFLALCAACSARDAQLPALRSEEHTSELQSLMRISYAAFRLKKNNLHK